MVRQVGAFEAKTRLSELLESVAQGEEIIITRRGKAVARLAPIKNTLDVQFSRDALARIRARAESAKLKAFDWTEWKRYRDLGRH